MNRTYSAAALLCLIRGWPLSATFICFSTPSSEYTVLTDVLPIGAPDYEEVSSLSPGTAYPGVTFSEPLIVLTAAASWIGWNNPPQVESNTPRVLFFDAQGVAGSTLSIVLSRGANVFGLEAQGEDLIDPGRDQITASFFHGSTLVGSITRTVDPRGGALLFAAQSSTTPFTRLQVESVRGTRSPFINTSFGIAQLRVSAATPEPGAAGPLTIALLGLGLLGRSRKP